MGASWLVGLGAAALSMAGDLATSFIKRRIGLASGSPVLGLDQVLEGWLPLLLLAPVLQLEPAPCVAVLGVFILLAHAGSRFWHYILYHPGRENYPRIIRSTTRLREWRACHAPLARWQTWFNFESYVYYRVVMTTAFKAIGWYDHGVRNVLAVRLQDRTLWLPTLPPAFDGFRILLLTDLHLDGTPRLTQALIRQVRHQPVDLCLVGGDVRMEIYGPMAPSIRRLGRLLAHVESRHGVYGVLGNHDCIEMLPEFERAGVTMLVNEAAAIGREGETLWVAGVDDPHFYRCHDLDLAMREVPAEAFTLLLAHSPEIYREAADHGVDLYLCGHTHGGQVCLPRIGPVFTHSSAPRFTAAGAWQWGEMQGYTSRGAGASGIPVRFNCPGEIPLLTLRRGTAP